MPCYEYACPRCGAREDRIVPVADRDQQSHRCTDGKVVPLKKLLSAPTAPAIFDSRARSRKAKAEGLIELGNETPATVQREIEKVRQQKREAKWDRIEREMGEQFHDLGESFYTRKPDRKRRRTRIREDAVGIEA